LVWRFVSFDLDVDGKGDAHLEVLLWEGAISLFVSRFILVPSYLGTKKCWVGLLNLFSMASLEVLCTKLGYSIIKKRIPLPYIVFLSLLLILSCVFVYSMIVSVTYLVQFHIPHLYVVWYSNIPPHPLLMCHE
jgi:hypothetical protein